MADHIGRPFALIMRLVDLIDIFYKHLRGADMSDGVKVKPSSGGWLGKADTSGVRISSTGQVTVDVATIVRSSKVQGQVAAAQRIRDAGRTKK